VVPLRSKPLFSNRILAEVGRWSYSIYIVHFPVLYGALKLQSRIFPAHRSGWDTLTLTTLALAVLASVALSALTYRLIEWPFLVRKASPKAERRPHAEATLSLT